MSTGNYILTETTAAFILNMDEQFFLDRKMTSGGRSEVDIMLTVSYSLKISKEKFFHSESGEVKEEIMEQLEKLFPEEIVLTEDAVAQREHLIHYPLIENKNCLRCASCGKWLYMPGKEYLPVSFEYCKVVKEIPLCSGCAWELEKDMENEEFVRKLKNRSSEKNRMGQDKCHCMAEE